MKNIFKKNKIKSEIVSRETLEKMIKDNGFYGLEVENSFEDDVINKITMKSQNINDIFKFAKENDIHTIFYGYYYYDKEFYTIDLKNLEEKYDKEVVDMMKRDVIEYNKKVNSIDFEKPIILVVYCIYNGCSITVELYDEWIEKEDILAGHEKMDLIFEQNQEKLESYIDKKAKQRDIELENLKQIIFQDEQFKKSTNKNLRTDYIYKFLEKNPNYSELFNYGNGVRFNAYKWIDIIWREYKDNK